jgi:hypothetical protein
MEQPFFIGQKVVALRFASNGAKTRQLTKGEHYTVEELIECPHCEYWNVLLKELRSDRGCSSCCSCPRILQSVSTHAFVPHEWLAPLPPAYENISHELAKDATPETSDVITIKQPILS